MNFPTALWLQTDSSNPLARMNAYIKRRTNVVGIFPNDRACIRLVGAKLLEQSDEWVPCINLHYYTTKHFAGAQTGVRQQLPPAQCRPDELPGSCLAPPSADGRVEPTDFRR